MKILFTSTILLFCLSAIFMISAEKKGKKFVSELTLHDFMEDYTKPATKLYEKQNNAEYLNKILDKVPAMAPADQQAEWKEIIDAKVAIGKPEDSCKSCHTKFKKEYKKNYRKKLIAVPEEFKNFPEEIRTLLKKK
ncbi:MAG: hypothetical protein O9264_02960 [Leptospira sp.]|nr:hypothetical protein [Leptospira sp.]